MADYQIFPRRPFFTYEVNGNRHVVALPFTRETDRFPRRCEVRKRTENNGDWTFENFDGQEYVRKADYLGRPKWYFKIAELKYIALEKDACDILNETYGSLIPPGSERQSEVENRSPRKANSKLESFFKRMQISNASLRSEDSSCTSQVDGNRPRTLLKEQALNGKQRIVFNNLKGMFKDYYSKKKNSALTELPHDCKLQNTTVHEVFKLVNVSSGDEKDFLKQSPSYLLKSQHAKKILLVGGPRFGKTTLLALLVYYWTNSCNFMSNFQLCLSFSLKDLHLQGDLSHAIVCKLLTGFERNFTISEDELLLTLASYSEEVILLLDGYDQLPHNSKRIVERFLKKPHPFLKSKVIVASRRKSEQDIATFFDCCIEICGIRDLEIDLVREVIRANNGTSTQTEQQYARNRLCVLADLPPYFVYFISKLCKINRPSDEKFNDLYSLLNNVVMLIPKHLPPNTFKTFSQSACISNYLFLKLGHFFFRALTKKYLTYQEDLMKKEFGAEFDDLIRWNFFYLENDTSYVKPAWSVTSKLMMVFLVTKYLRYKWELLSTDEDREDFLNRSLCCSACRGDYVLGNGQNPYLYYVGMLPEIVLSLHSGCSLDKATFQMVYDVEYIDCSNVFDTVNLLLRVKRSFLHRISFIVLNQDDEEFCEMFGGVLNSLKFDYCCVEYQFYYNVYENKCFLEIEVNDSSDITVLNAVFRKNSRGLSDGVLMNFLLEHLDDVLDFVTAVLSSTLKGFQHEFEKFKHVDEQLFNKIILSLLTSSVKSPVILTCIESKEGTLIGQQTSVAFAVFQNPETKTNRTKYWIQNLEEQRIYDLGIIAKEDIHEIKKAISKCLKIMKNPKVSIQLL